MIEVNKVEERQKGEKDGKKPGEEKMIRREGKR